VKTLRAKLRAVMPDVDPIRTVRGTGYALQDEPPPRA
jgi:two-component system catabolic regulation response regulator CreB